MWFDLLAVQVTLKTLLQHHSSKTSILWCSATLWFNSHIHQSDGKTIALTPGNFVGKVMSLLFNMLSMLVITFLPRWKASFNFLAEVTINSDFGAQENKCCHCFHFSSSICFEVVGPDAMIFIFSMLNFQAAFALSSFSFIKRLFSSSLLSAFRVVSSAYLRLLIFLLEILIPACDSSSPAFLMM